MPRLPEPFHAGELAVQKRMGVELEAIQNSVLVRGDPDVGVARNIARADVAALTTRLDEKLRIDLSTGPTGFVEIRSPSTVRFHCDHVLARSLVDGVGQNGLIGGLTLGFGARQRTRVNGTGTVIDETTLEIEADEVFVNCTKYIATRVPSGDSPTETTSLDVSGFVGGADMFFIGSHHADRGLDASHRGGNAGFVTFDGDTLSWIEYPGNAMYQTMGNLVENPEVAVIVPDLVTGRQVHFHGSARIEFGDTTAITVELDAVEPGRLATTRRWAVERPSPYNPNLD